MKQVFCMLHTFACCILHQSEIRYDIHCILYRLCWTVGNQNRSISWQVRSCPESCPHNLALYPDSCVLEVMEFWYQSGQWAWFYIYEGGWFRYNDFILICVNILLGYYKLLKSYKVGIMSLHWIECVEAWSINDEVSCWWTS